MGGGVKSSFAIAKSSSLVDLKKMLRTGSSLSTMPANDDLIASRH